MSRHPRTMDAVPAATARVANACVPHGHPDLPRDAALGTRFCDQAVADLCAVRGQPAVAPSRLALVPL